MALIGRARLTPSKIELLQAWIPAQTWIGELDLAGLASLGSFRFDDPAGEVGVETHLLSTEAGTVLQVPLTYRAEPLDGGFAVGTMQHSMLGQRWVYDGLSDPVYLQALVATILTGADQAELFLEADSERQPLPLSVGVHGSGTPGTPVPAVRVGAVSVDGSDRVVDAGPLIVTVRAVVDSVSVPDDVMTLTGTRIGADGPMLLATVRLS